MVVLRTQSEFGHAPPPQTPYSIVTNIPGWDASQTVRDGDLSSFARIVHIYPRFSPTHFAAMLGKAIAEKAGMEGKAVMMYYNPEMLPYTLQHSTSKHREEDMMKAEDLTFRSVDVAGHRLYAALYDPPKMKGILLSWGNPGLGLSIRAGEELLKGVDDMTVGPCDVDAPPAPTWTPESWAHQGIRHRITELLHRAARNPATVTCKPGDVYLYPTGMGGIYHLNKLMQRYRPATFVILGVVFHNTYHHLIEECPDGFKYFGHVDRKGIDGFEEWLDAEAAAGRDVSCVFIEAPGNPTLEMPDLPRLKALSEKHGFVFVVDDTIAGFGNVDVFERSDILLTSLTKSFSGQADVMGGSIVLNPQSPHYAALAPLYADSHHNELFAGDAEVLLANSHDFLARTRVLNRNAEAMATFLHSTISDPDSPITNVQFPSLLPSRPLYDAHMRRSTTDLPAPGYGCLMTVEFESTALARTFYDRCGFYPSPHLGGHVTIMLCYNMFIWGRKDAERAQMRELGVKEESIRFSAGLENVEDLIDTLKDALDFTIAAKKSTAENGKQNGTTENGTTEEMTK